MEDINRSEVGAVPAARIATLGLRGLGQPQYCPIANHSQPLEARLNDVCEAVQLFVAGCKAPLRDHNISKMALLGYDFCSILFGYIMFYSILQMITMLCSTLVNVWSFPVGCIKGQ